MNRQLPFLCLCEAVRVLKLETRGILTGGCPGDQGDTAVEDASTHHDRFLSSSVWYRSLETDRLLLERNGREKELEDNKEQRLFTVVIDTSGVRRG